MRDSENSNFHNVSHGHQNHKQSANVQIHKGDHPGPNDNSHFQESIKAIAEFVWVAEEANWGEQWKDPVQ